MKVTDHLKTAKDTLFSFEILPPLKGKGIQSIFDGIDPLMEFKPKFVNVTYHREEFLYKERENGLLEKIAIRKRPGTVGICAAIMNKYTVDAVPHLICGGFSKEEKENALIDLQFLGIDNVLALRGDSIKTESGGKSEASSLVLGICAATATGLSADFPPPVGRRASRRQKRPARWLSPVGRVAIQR